MKVGERGQVTIPKALRDRFGLCPRSEVEFLDINGQLVLRKQPEPRRKSLRRWVGFLQNEPDDVDGFIEEIRGR